MNILNNGYHEDDVAIVGMSCCFPQSENIDKFWSNLKEGRECITHFSEEELKTAGIEEEKLENVHYVKASGCIDGIEFFDAKFFDYSPKEASIIDPQQRIFLEQSFKALEDAGCNPENYKGAIGVYASAGMNTYLLRNLITHSELMEEGGGYPIMVSNDKDFLATRVSYKLNLRGPSMTVQTACSSSMVAIHCACQALQNGECDCAIAGGVSVRVPQKTGYMYYEGLILSPDGHCRAFDKDAKGTVFGNGAGVIVLKLLTDAIADGDDIYAVIKGTAINNDGSAKAGFTAPGMESQAAAIYEAMSFADVKPSDISYVETHGTGTNIGDPIEIAALSKAYQSKEMKKGSCAIGSVKTNIGHLDSASGVAGVIKTALALKHNAIPASLHYHTPNPKIDFEHSPFYVNTALTSWPDKEAGKYAAVSSFGIGGTNAHMILQEAPCRTETERNFRRKQYILCLSAKSEKVLKQKEEELAIFLQQQKVRMEDICYSLSCSRQNMKYRMTFVCESSKEAVEILEKKTEHFVYKCKSENNVFHPVFLFPGQGSQYVNMGLELYQNEIVFKDTMDECFCILRELMGTDIKDILYPKAGEEEKAALLLKNTLYTQPALFIVEYSTAKLFLSWGILPKAMAGHSLGEYTAACIAEVFTLREALKLIVCRARLIASLPEGSMLSVMMSEKELIPFISEDVSIAAVNAENSTVLSGKTEVIAEYRDKLAARGIITKELETSHAFHSAMLDTILPAFMEEVKKVHFCKPQIPYVSTYTGEWIREEDVLDCNYWTAHLRNTVRFHDAASKLLEAPDVNFIEIGPGKVLSSLLKSHENKSRDTIILNTFPHQKEQKSAEKVVCETLSVLWASGGEINWKSYYETEEYKKIRLPLYPFERRKYWIEPLSVEYSEKKADLLYEMEEEDKQEEFYEDDRSSLSSDYAEAQNNTEKILIAIWENVLGVNPIGINDNFFELGGTSLMINQIISAIGKEFGEMPVSVSELYNHQTVQALAEYINTLILLKQQNSQNFWELEAYEEGEI